jgi:hypothetical protein
MKLLIKFPTRSRPEKFLKILDLYYKKCANPALTEFCITIDEDDLSMNNEKVLSILDGYKNLSYFIGHSASKIAACNVDIDRMEGWDIVLLASDDMIPQIDSYDEIIRGTMERYYSDTDGVLWFFDGDKRDLNTLCILGKKYYDRFGYIYHPGYKSLFCDVEFTKVANMLQKQTFIEQVIIKHEHPDIPEYKDNFDALYSRNNSLYSGDSKLFKKRKRKKFGLK